MSKVRLIFSEAWSSISANVSTTFAATITVLISMFLLGLFIALGTWVLSYSNHVKRELVVHVYFATGQHQPTQAEEAQVGQQLRRDPRVATVTYISKEAAFKAQAKKLPSLYANVPTNPLP
ncbi:MAG: permease-like cell division protein FtsX, partial [Acidobacteriota bacterium]|nr:permease-like cell division protein FtsX [Acidobacteriota bacterium]